MISLIFYKSFDYRTNVVITPQVIFRTTWNIYVTHCSNVNYAIVKNLKFSGRFQSYAKNRTFNYSLEFWYYLLDCFDNRLEIIFFLSY